MSNDFMVDNESPIDTQQEPAAKRPMTLKLLRRRIARIEQMDDVKAARKSRQKLYKSVLTAIASGNVKGAKRLAATVLGENVPAARRPVGV